MLQAAVLRELQGDRMGRLDHLSARLFCELLSRKLRLSHPGHAAHKVLAVYERVPAAGQNGRDAALLCTAKVLQHGLDLLRPRQENHQEPLAADDCRRVWVSVEVSWRRNRRMRDGELFCLGNHLLALSLAEREHL